MNEETVLAEITGMLRDVLDGYLDGSDVAGIEVTMETRFHEDLDMESIDLVALGSRLSERYGEWVNFAEFIAGLDLDEIIDLTVGRLVGYVVAAQRTATVTA
jgi:acyl carrier protein